MMIGERVLNDLEAGVPQQVEKALRVTDPGYRMHLPASEVPDCGRAIVVQTAYRGSRQGHRKLTLAALAVRDYDVGARQPCAHRFEGRAAADLAEHGQHRLELRERVLRAGARLIFSARRMTLALRDLDDAEVASLANRRVHPRLPELTVQAILDDLLGIQDWPGGVNVNGDGEDDIRLKFLTQE